MKVILAFIIGFLIGEISGLFVMGLCAANGRNRDEDE